MPRRAMVRPSHREVGRSSLTCQVYGSATARRRLRKVVAVTETPDPDRLSGPATPANAAELAKYLPLSQRPRRDEKAVSGNWSEQGARALLQFADLLEALSEADWLTPSARPGFRVADVAGLVVWRAATPRLARFRELVARALRDHQRRSAAELSLGREIAARGRTGLEAELRSLAARTAAAGSSRSVSDLAAVVLACYETSSVVGEPIIVDPVASGAVALARSLNAPVEIKAVLKTRALVSTDGDWRVGSGAVLRGTSAEIVLFLYGRAGLPPATG